MTNCSAITHTDGQAPFSLPGACQFDMVSARGESYRIFVYIPSIPSPAPGFPVLYLLDGNATFATAVGTAAMQMHRPEITGVPACVIVGIGYSAAAPLDIERRSIDYTPGHEIDGQSGAVRFSDFIENDLKPAIETLAPIDREREAIFGHSYGGLFTLWSLFTRPGLFQSYIAASPSIWWGDRHVLSHEAAFIERTHASPHATRLLVTAGGLERAPPKQPQQHLKQFLVDDASALVARLRLKASPRLCATFVEFADETHVSVIPAALSRSVRFAWSAS